MSLAELNAGMLLNVLERVGLGGFKAQVKEKGTTGAILFHCSSPEDVKDVTGTPLPVARTLYTLVSDWKVNGVPRDLLATTEIAMTQASFEKPAPAESPAMSPTKVTNVLIVSPFVAHTAAVESIDASKYPSKYFVSGLGFANRHWNGTYYKVGGVNQYGYPRYKTQETRVVAFDWLWGMFYGLCCCPLLAHPATLYYNGHQWEFEPGTIDSTCGYGAPVDCQPCGLIPHNVLGPSGYFPTGNWEDGVSVTENKPN